MIDEKGARRLTVAIIKSAYDDLEVLYKQVKMIRSLCRQGKLQKYLENHAMKLRDGKLVKTFPYNNSDHQSAVSFFQGQWGSQLMSGIDLDIEGLGPEFHEKLNTVVGYKRYCHKCVQGKYSAAARAVKRRHEDMEEGL